MPNPLKKPKLGGISRFFVSSVRSKAKNGVGDSPLVVQAGFPTSVADFVVKNRSRLKKTPRWRRTPCPTEDVGSAKCSTVAVLATEIVAAAVGSDSVDEGLLPSSGGPQRGIHEQLQRPPVVDKCRGVEFENDFHYRGLRSEVPDKEGPQDVPVLTGKLLKVEVFERLDQLKKTRNRVFQHIPTSKSRKDEAFPSCSPPEVPITQHRECSPLAVARRDEVCKDQSVPAGTERKVIGGGLMTVAKMAFIVLVLALVSKKIAMAVSALAFAFLFAESVGKRLIPLFGPCGDAKKSLEGIPQSLLNSDLAQTQDDLASNAQGGVLSTGISFACLGPLGSGRRYQPAKFSVNAAAPAVETTSSASEEKRNLKVEGCLDDQESSVASRKEEKNKRKKKLFGNIILHKFRIGKNVNGGKAEGKLGPASLWHGRSQNGTQEDAMEEEEETDEEDDDRQRIPAIARDACFNIPSKVSSKHLVFFVLIFCGLIGGRVAALLLTVGGLCVSSVKSLWRGWNSGHSVEALPDATPLASTRKM